MQNTQKTSLPRRIFCVITQGELGGAQQFMAQLATHLDHERFTLHVVWGAGSDGALARALEGHATFATARHLTRGISPLRDWLAVRELRAQMLKFHPDVVLCMSSKAGFVGALAAHGLRSQLPGLRVVYRIGGWAFNDPRPRWQKRLFVWLEQLSARWKDDIVVNNTHDLDQAHRLRIAPRNRVYRIYNGIDPYLPFMPTAQARAVLDGRMERDAGPYEWLVGTVANLYPTKDVATFVAAAARIGGNVRFAVIGDGAQRSELEQLVDRYDLGKRFVFLGRMDRAWQYLQAFDVFVLPSLKEGFPWALLEAMAAKVPAVATHVGAVPEMLIDGQSGLVVPPSDPEALAHGIVRILEDEHLRRELPIAAHQTVITKFSLHAMVDAFERILS
jgi:glycosyltransferase involved in cell wall biosynthesis